LNDTFKSVTNRKHNKPKTNPSINIQKDNLQNNLKINWFDKVIRGFYDENLKFSFSVDCLQKNCGLANQLKAYKFCFEMTINPGLKVLNKN